MNIEIKEIATDYNHSEIFPAPGGGNVITDGRSLYVTYGIITYDANSREIHYVSPSAVCFNSLLHLVYTDIGKSPRERIYYDRIK